jgi:hypothetical protein
MGRPSGTAGKPLGRYPEFDGAPLLFWNPSQKVLSEAPNGTNGGGSPRGRDLGPFRLGVSAWNPSIIIAPQLGT